MKTFKLFNFNRRTAMVQADGCTAARPKIGVTPRTTSTIGRFASVLCIILIMLLTLGVGQMWATDYILGPDGSWTENAAHTLGSSGITNWVYKDLTVTGQWNNFKVLNGSTWYGKDSGGNNVTPGTEYTPTTTGDNMYCDFKESSLTYYFFFNTSTHKLMIQPKYYLAGTCGASNQNWGQTQNAPTYDATNGYFKWNTCTLNTSTDYKFKLCTYSTWSYYNYQDGGSVTVANGTKKATDGDNNIIFRPSHAGTAVITMVPTSNVMVVNCPYQVSYNKGTGATGSVSASAITTYGSTCTLSSSTFSKTGYTQDGWATSDGGNKVYDLGDTYTGGYTDVTLYPHWVENTYNQTIAISPTSTGTTSPTAGTGKAIKQVTGTSVTATPATNYAFDYWSVSGGGLAIKSPSTSTSNPATFTATSAGGTITANFAPQWTLKGGDSDDTSNSSSDAMGNWETFNNFALTSGTTMKCTLALAAKTTYSFKVYDRKNDKWYGNTSAFVGQTSSLTMATGKGDCHITTAKAGNYIFTFDNSAKTLTVTYPTETHPSANYIYFKNTASWSTVYAHMWNATHTADEYPGPALPTFTFNGGTYYYAAIGSETTVIFGNNNDSRKTGDLSSANTHTRQYYEYSSSSWKNFTVSITYKDVGNTAFSGTHEVGYPTIHTYGTSTTLDSPTKDNYNFDGWFQYSTGTGSSVSTINGAAKSTDFTLYAKWSEITHDVKATYGSGGSAATPSDWTAMGEVTGGAITATNATGYHFTGWTILDSKGGSFADASSASTTFYPVSNDTWVKANFAPNTYDITLDGNEGSDGSATATYNSSTLTITHSSRVGYSLDGYFTATSGGTKVINADGTLVASAGSYTNSSSQWIYDDDVELHAQWTENLVNYTVTYGVKSDQTSLGTLSCATTTGSTPVSSGGEVASGTGVTFTAVPITGYEVDAWCSDAACNTPIAGAGYANTYATTVNANTTVYVKFKKKVYTITYSPSSAPTGCTYTTKPGSGTYGNTITMVFTPSTGYSVSVSARDASSNVVTISNPSANTYTFTQPASAVTVTVTTTQIMSALSTSCHYDVGNPGYAAPTVSGSATTVGYATTRTITATAAGTGYTFVGWTLTNCTRTDGGEDTATTITVRSNGDGAAASVVANYEEVLTSPWHLLGAATPFGGWSSSSSNMLQKASGSSTGSVASITINVSALPSAEEYTFKLYNATTDKWRTNAGYWVTRANNNPTLSTEGGTDNELIFKPDVVGNYTFTLDYSSANPVLTVTFPTSYTLTYNIGTVKGNDGSISTSPTTASGSKVLSGTDITLTAPAPKAGYSWKGWFTNAAGTTGHIEDEGRAITVTMNANKTLYACYTENDYTVTVAATAGGTITTPASPATTVTAHPATTAAIVAEEAEGYYFVKWTTEDDGITIANANNKSTTITATADGTVTANFAELDKIFFRNENEATGEKLWDVNKMYVYFNVDWGRSGAAEDGVTTSAGKFAEMNPVSAGSNIFWAYIPRAITKANYTKIAFSDIWMGTTYPNDLYGEFWQNKGVYRADYISYLNMFVPACKSSNTSNLTTYYSNGYWMKYDTQTDQGASYYLKESTGSGELSEFKVAAPNGNAIYTTYRFENTTAKRFYIANAKGTFYKANSNITSVAYADVEMGEGNGGFLVTPTAEGDYTFTIDQSGDTMKISVNYPISKGDYQLVYTYASGSKTHTSDIIKFESTVQTTKKSVYIDPTGGVSLKLQKCTGIDGETKQPTWTTGVSVGTLSTIFTKGKGVYVFDVNINNTGKADNADAAVTLSNVALYDGQYYIKTDYAPGGWVNYKRNILTQNTINFSKSDSKTFDYYHCAWVGDGDKNVKCIIANDYNQQITDTLIGDDVLGLDGGKPRQYLATAANVRFSYNSYTNELKRAYINGSSDQHAYYLYLEGIDVDANLNTVGTQTSNTLSDRNNWTYMLNIQAQPGARVRLTAKYGSQGGGVVQNLIGDKDGALSTANTVEIMGGSGTDWSNLRVVYDFKTNNLMTAWLVPSGTIESDKEIFADVMIIRKDQGDAEQITFGGSAKKLDEVGVVYSTMQFTYNHLANKKANGSDSTLVSTEREFYWISFPHDVLISDIFGSVGDFYNEWGILYYDGKERAKDGYWADSKGFWKYFTNPNDTLKAFEGYVLEVDYPLVGTVADEGKWINGVRDLYLYFPSIKDIGNIHKGDTTINIDQTGYKCEIDRRTDKETPDINKDRRIADSYWHLIGVPSFKDASHDTGTGWIDTDSDTKVDLPDISDWSTASVPFVYEWDKKTDKYTPVTTSSFTFKAMYSYMVQYSGSTITWNSISAPKPVSVAPRRSPQEDNGAYEWRLSLLNGEEEQDRTFIRMTNQEDVTAGFEFNYDMCKEINKNAANIYTFADYVPVAGNVLPASSQTTVIPVGVKIATNGDYTFSIPEGTEGVGVTLIDQETGIRTNLSALDYTVSLEAGNNDNRFVLEVSPIYNMPTEIEQSGISKQQSAVKKVLIDGLLYIVRDGKIYDARGARVE